MLVLQRDRIRGDIGPCRADLETSISDGYLEAMNVGLGPWVDVGQHGRVIWRLMRPLFNGLSVGSFRTLVPNQNPGPEVPAQAPAWSVAE